MILDGKRISQEIKDELREKVAALKARGKESAPDPGYGSDGI